MARAAGYVDSPGPGIWQLTDRGRELLAQYPEGFDDETARLVIRASRREIRSGDPGDDSPADISGPAAQQTPDERIDAAAREIQNAVAQELLDRIGQAPPAFFEELVLDLLHALGYGASEELSESVAPVTAGSMESSLSTSSASKESTCRLRDGRAPSVDPTSRRSTARLPVDARGRVSSSPLQPSPGKRGTSRVRLPSTSCSSMVPDSRP